MGSVVRPSSIGTVLRGEDVEGHLLALRFVSAGERDTNFDGVADRQPIVFAEVIDLTSGEARSLGRQGISWKTTMAQLVARPGDWLVGRPITVEAKGGGFSYFVLADGTDEEYEMAERLLP